MHEWSIFILYSPMIPRFAWRLITCSECVPGVNTCICMCMCVLQLCRCTCVGWINVHAYVLHAYVHVCAWCACKNLFCSEFFVFLCCCASGGPLFRLQISGAMKLLLLFYSVLATSSLNPPCALFPNTDFQCVDKPLSNCDIAHARAKDVMSCCALCKANAKCFAASWNKHGTCYFKSRDAAPVPPRSGLPPTTSCSCRGPVPPPLPPSPLCNGTARGRYSVAVVQRTLGKDGGSLISKVNRSSDLEYNFNTAWFPSNGDVSEGLVVRVEDKHFYHHSIAIVAANLSSSHPTTERVTPQSIFWPGITPPPKNSFWGPIDPRIAYRQATKLYHLSWDNATNGCAFRQTQLSTSPNPFDHESWDHHGAVLAGASHQASTAGASFLFREPSAHVAFVSTGTMAHPGWEQVLVIARSSDAIQWDVQTCNITNANRCCNDTFAIAVNNTDNSPSSPQQCLGNNCCSPTPVCTDPEGMRCTHPTAGVGRRVLLAPRPGCWDSGAICGGPQPEKLSNGNFLHIYNHDSHGYTTPVGRCAFGWAILDGDDPTQVVARSDKPIITGCDCYTEQCDVCGEPWEVSGQTNQVVFADGLRPMGGDEFVVTYGAGDKVVGAVRIRVMHGEEEEGNDVLPVTEWDSCWVLLSGISTLIIVEWSLTLLVNSRAKPG